MKLIRSYFFCFILLLTLIGCGKDSASESSSSSTSYGKVTVKVANAAGFTINLMDDLRNLPQILTTTAQPTTLKIRLLYFMVGNFNETTASWASGQAFFVYEFPSCTTVTLDTSGASYGSLSSDSVCSTQMDAATGLGYLDLATSSSALNTALSAQAVKVPAGTYTHFELALLGAQQGGNNTFSNLTWTHSSVTGTQTYALKKTEYINKFSSPLVLAKGDSVLATVAYDISNVLTLGATATSNNTTHCVNDTGSTQSCVTLPTLTFSVTKQ